MPPHFPKNRHKARNAFMALKQKKGWECACHKISCQKKAEKCMCISAKTTVYIRMADLETGNTTILLSGLPLPLTFNPLPPPSLLLYAWSNSARPPLPFPPPPPRHIRTHSKCAKRRERNTNPPQPPSSTEIGEEEGK